MLTYKIDTSTKQIHTQSLIHSVCYWTFQKKNITVISSDFPNAVGYHLNQATRCKDQCGHNQIVGIQNVKRHIHSIAFLVFAFCNTRLRKSNVCRSRGVDDTVCLQFYSYLFYNLYPICTHLCSVYNSNTFVLDTSEPRNNEVFIISFI